MIDLGQTYRATLTVTDDAGRPANPATVTLTITLPDGTVLTPAVTLPPDVTGLLVYDYATTMAGLHKAAWRTQGPAAASADYFSVRDFISILSFDEAMSHLNITRIAADGGAELRRFMQASTELVEAKAGVCVRRVFTDRVSEGHYSLILPRRPVLSVTSVTSAQPGGPSWDPSLLITDGEAGIVSPAVGRVPFWWPPWDVTYTCGRAQIPERFAHAAKEQLRHLWETQRGAQPPSLLSGEETFTATTGWSFSVPRRVLELLEQDMVPSS